MTRQRRSAEADHWQRAWSIFHDAIEHDGRGRAALLARSCGDDAALRSEVMSLLRSFDRLGGFLEVSVRGPGGLADVAGGRLPRRSPGTTADRSLEGHTIDGYRIGPLVGRGGMGVVHDAEQLNPRRRVAFKALRPGLVGTKAIERLQLESTVLARLAHPGIAQVFAAGTFDHGDGVRPYFVMELVDGTPLDEVARRAGVSLNDRLELMAKVADAIEHAHARGVVHRDLKPSNILVVEVPTGGGRPTLHPKVVDFGVARVHDGEIRRVTSTGQPGLLGTLPYMSPEQLDGVDVDARCDVYALGVVTYELLTGRLPYDTPTGSPYALIDAIRYGRTVPLGAMRGVLRGDAEAIVSTALAPEPERRYPTAGGLATDLRRLLRHEPIVARRPSRLYLARRFARRNRVGVASAAAVVLTLAGGLVASLVQGDRARRAEQRATLLFGDVRGLASRMIEDIEPRIAELPGATDVRVAVVEAMLEYYDRLEQHSGNDEALLREVASGLEAQGNTLGKLRDTPAAHETFAAALAIVERLLADEPDDFGLALHEARLTLKVAASDEAPLDYRETRDPLLERAVDLFEALLAEQRSPEVQHGMAAALYRLAFYQCEAYGGPIAVARRAVALSAAAAEARPDVAVYRKRASKCQYYLHLLLDEHGDFDGAIEALTRAEEVLEPLAAAKPSVGVMTDLSSLLAHRAVLESRLGRVEAATASSDRAMALATRLVEADPYDGLAFRYEGVATERRAVLHETLAERGLSPDEQLHHWREALRWRRRALEHVLEREARGQLDPWEADYADEHREHIEQVRRAIEALTGTAMP